MCNEHKYTINSKSDSQVFYKLLHTPIYLCQNLELYILPYDEEKKVSELHFSSVCSRFVAAGFLIKAPRAALRNCIARF